MDIIRNVEGALWVRLTCILGVGRTRTGLKGAGLVGVRYTVPAMPATIDEALEVLDGTGPEFGGGLSNHGPMAAEALFALGRGDAVIPWVERYKRRLQDHPDARNPISGDSWREALGDVGRVGDWVALFDRELAEAPWPTVLKEWVPRLTPGLIAAATHGVIRTGHAVRSLASAETAKRRHELAEGLGYWAARYQLLPGAPSSTSGDLLPSEAVRHIETLPSGQKRFGLISDALRRLDDFPAFEGAINLVDTAGDAPRILSDLTETFATVYLANAHTGQVIAFIHAVTGPSAIRLLAPHLTPEATQTALRYGWQAGAALYAAMGETLEATVVEAPDESSDDLIDRAVATGDEHAIKFTEACLREHALNPKPVYLAAARHASGVLGGS